MDLLSMNASSQAQPAIRGAKQRTSGRRGFAGLVGIHSGVRLLYQIIKFTAVSGIHGHPDTGGDVDASAAN